MSENPPKLGLENEPISDWTETKPQPKIISKSLEEGRIFSEAEGGGKEAIQTVVECDGENHTRFKERVIYAADGGMTSTEEIERGVVGACDCEGTEHKSEELPQAA